MCTCMERGGEGWREGWRGVERGVERGGERGGEGWREGWREVEGDGEVSAQGGLCKKAEVAGDRHNQYGRVWAPFRSQGALIFAPRGLADKREALNVEYVHVGVKVARGGARWKGGWRESHQCPDSHLITNSTPDLLTLRLALLPSLLHLAVYLLPHLPHAPPGVGTTWCRNHLV
ncbi:unnamed protein product [Closterium sp. NIES-64]|nr:unnamed protein product [Closterium sp. NIES-64]